VDLEGVEVFVDAMVLNGILAGVLLGLAGLWLLVLRGALWRAWLQQQHGHALADAAQRLGLTRRPAGLGATLCLERKASDGGRIRLVLTARNGVPRAMLQAPLRGRVLLSPGAESSLADQAEAVLGRAHGGDA